MPRPKPTAKPSSSSTPSSSSKTTTTNPPPNWPLFRPPLPVVDVTPEAHPDSPATIALIRTFFPRSLCQDYVSFFLRALDFQIASGRPKRGEARRFNDRFQVDDPAFARRLWEQTGLREALSSSDDLVHLWGGVPVGLNPNIRVYRYTTGQFFDGHYDDYNDVTIPGDPPLEARTTWTLLLYLTSAAEGLEGGETIFYPEEKDSPPGGIRVSPETGMLLLHKHGHRCLFHEGAEVTAGEKWILRTDLCIDRREWTATF